ncbi:MAG: hypothetical protein K9H14_01070 [Actinomycetia bacterium]|nr:hypothetical protein [Actinomycetes bacterium]
MYFKKPGKIAFILSLAIMLVLFLVPTSVYAQPAKSTYEFSYDLSGKTFVAGGSGTDVPVTLSTDTLGSEGYSNVIYKVSYSGPGTAELWASDSSGTYDVAAIGRWGPASGFALDADFSATTSFECKFDTAGTYTINFELYDLDSDSTITSGSAEINVLEAGKSEYGFSYDVGGKEFIVNEPTVIPVTLQATTTRSEGYGLVIIDVEVNGPGTAKLLAKDTTGTEYDIAAEKHWGPKTGFPLPPDYSATTDVTAIFDTAGDYTITLTLINLSEPVTLMVADKVILPEQMILAQASETITVTEPGQPAQDTNKPASSPEETETAVFTITASGGSGGSISDEGVTEVTQGNDKTYIITPKDGYEISEVMVDGVPVGAVDSYTFSNVDSNHTIYVDFGIIGQIEAAGITEEKETVEVAGVTEELPYTGYDWFHYILAAAALLTAACLCTYLRIEGAKK